MPTEPRRNTHPIRRWGVRRFKSVEEADLVIAPLTVVVGANSSGKSTLLQSILLMAQAAHEWSESTGSVQLNGPLVELGTLDEVKTFGTPEAGFVVRCELSLEGVELNRGASRPITTRPIDVGWEVAFGGHPPRQPSSTLWQKIIFVASWLDDNGQRSELVVDARRTAQSAEDQTAFALGSLAGSPEVSGFGIDTLGGRESVPCSGELHVGGTTTAIRRLYAPMGLPIAAFVEIDFHDLLASMWADEFRTRTPLHIPEGSRSRKKGIELAVQKTEEIAGIAAFELLDWLKVKRPALESFVRQSAQEALQRPDWRQFAWAVPQPELQRRIKDTLGAGPTALVWRPIASRPRVWLAVVDFLGEHVTYLGPIREEPRVTYQSASRARPLFLGRRGEHTAAIFHQRKSELMSVPWPEGGQRRVKLAAAVKAWMTRIVGAGSVATTDRSRLQLDLTVHPASLPQSVSLTSVGVGVSQVLPVVVACLITEPGDTILLEQPELHLHPAAQQRLADFFLACAKSGRQLIVETHSEYIVTRLRRSIAEDLTDETLGLVGLVNATQVDGRTHFEEVPTSRLGALMEWPEGFFDQSISDAEELIRAAFRKQSGTPPD